MGHKGDIESRYSTNKRLPPDMIEEMRSAYVRASKYFETEDHDMKEEDITKITTETAIMILETAYGIKLQGWEINPLFSALSRAVAKYALRT